MVKRLLFVARAGDGLLDAAGNQFLILPPLGGTPGKAT
jgi:hypothetical protein